MAIRTCFGASHQTGWTGLIPLLLHPRSPEDPCSLMISPMNPGA
ncbi:MAG: hypothetical protein WDN69_24410 [Aliidongia sp.]